MEFLEITSHEELLGDLPIEDETFIVILTQKRSGEINEINPVDYYDVYLVRDGMPVHLWAHRSFEGFVALVTRGNDREPLKDQPLIEWLTQIFYPATLPKENRAEFVRRMKVAGLSFQSK